MLDYGVDWCVLIWELISELKIEKSQHDEIFVEKFQSFSSLVSFTGKAFGPKYYAQIFNGYGPTKIFNRKNVYKKFNVLLVSLFFTVDHNEEVLWNQNIVDCGFYEEKSLSWSSWKGKISWGAEVHLLDAKISKVCQ